MKNTGKQYEALTEAVFTRLLAQSDVCAKVERDVVLEGRSTKHQIDVTFEFTAGPVQYRTIVQCKDWEAAVKQEQILTFQSVLSDIPGQPRGIVVSRSGFQDGARRVADHHGIKLYELREPRDEDWQGLIRTVLIKMQMRFPSFEDVQFVLDEEGIRAELSVRGQPGFDVNFSGHPDLTRVVFASSGEVCDWNGILNSLVPPTGAGPFRVRHEFTESVVVTFPDSPIPKLPLLGIEATIHVSDIERDIRVSIDHLVAYCFKDVLGGNVRFLGADGGPVRDRGEGGP